MANYNLQGDGLIQGKNCIVRAGNSPADAKQIGLVQDFEMRAQFQTQKAEVIGEFLPVSIDITSVSVSTTFSGFIPVKGYDLDESSVVKIPYLELYDKKKGAVVSSTTWAVISSYSERTSGKGYTTVNCSFESIGMWNGSDYPSSELFTK